MWGFLMPSGVGVTDGGLFQGWSLDWGNSRRGGLERSFHGIIPDFLGLWMPGTGVNLPPEHPRHFGYVDASSYLATSCGRGAM